MRRGYGTQLRAGGREWKVEAGNMRSVRQRSSRQAQALEASVHGRFVRVDVRPNERRAVIIGDDESV